MNSIWKNIEKEIREMKKIDYFMAGLILIDIIGIIVATPLLIISIFFAF